MMFQISHGIISLRLEIFALAFGVVIILLDLLNLRMSLFHLYFTAKELFPLDTEL